MNDPNKPNEEPRRVSQPSQNPPVQAPGNPPSEYERNVPHNPDPSVAMTADKGEGSYEGTRKYQEGYKKFSQQTSPDDARKKAEKIDTNDPSLKQAEQRGKSAGRVSAPSIH